MNSKNIVDMDIKNSMNDTKKQEEEKIELIGVTLLLSFKNFFSPITLFLKTRKKKTDKHLEENRWFQGHFHSLSEMLNRFY